MLAGIRAALTLQETVPSLFQQSQVILNPPSFHNIEHQQIETTKTSVPSIINSHTSKLPPTMEDPLFRVWSGPQFEALLIRDAAYRSDLCFKCKDAVSSALTQRLDEITMLASLEGLTLGPASPALQGARYWQTLIDPDTDMPAEDTRIMCEKEGRRIAVDGATILWTLKQTPGYQKMKDCWAVGEIKYKILYALEGTLEAADMRDAYQTYPSPRNVREEQGLYARFTQMHWDRYEEFMAETWMNPDCKYIYPCDCRDLISTHQHIRSRYYTSLSNSAFEREAEVLWSLYHIQMRITGSVHAWSPPGNTMGWMCWLHREATFDGSRPEGVSIVVPIVLAMIRGEAFDMWLSMQAGTVDLEVGLMARLAGQARSNAQALEAELLQGKMCPNMQSLTVHEEEEL